MEQVTAFAGFAIYASFDGMAPGSEDLLLVATRDVADRVVAFLDNSPTLWECFATVKDEDGELVGGFEDLKSFCVREALRRTDEEFQTDFDEVCDQLRAIAEV